MGVRKWKRGCAAVLTSVMVLTPSLSALAAIAETSGDIASGSVAAAEALEDRIPGFEGAEAASPSDAGEISGEDKETEADGTLSDSVELINDLGQESDGDPDYDPASGSDAVRNEGISDESYDVTDYDLASDSDAELINDLPEGTTVIADAVVVVEPVALTAEDIIDSGTCGDDLNWTLDSDGLLTIFGTGDMDNYTSSLAPWYSYRNSISEIMIDDGVTSIGSKAFWLCTGLLDISIADSVISIGDSAFSGCTSLTSVNIPSEITEINSSTFYNCKGLESVSIPDNVTTIGSGAFIYCESLTDITLPDSVTSIGESAFYNCRNLVRIIIPDSVLNIGNSAFAGCSSLLDITIPGSVSDINMFVFDGCTGLINVILSDGVTSIGYAVFSGCTSLESITIPDSVQSIGSMAFSGCTSLNSISIPDSTINKIYGHAFQNCIGLANDDGLIIIQNILFDYCGDSVEVTVPEEVTLINEYAFEGCEVLTSITLSENVESIGMCAFANCINLSDINFPDTMIDIEKYAFSGCAGLTDVIIPEGITSIEYGTFSGCSNLVSVTIPDGVTNIDISAFKKCESLSGIIIPDSVTKIGVSAFDSCSGLSEIIFLGSAPSIGYNSFSGVTATVFYLANDDTWTNDIMQDYGGSLTWVSLSGIANGSCGNNLEWSLDENGILSISGTGTMANWNGQSEVPWHNYRILITEVNIDDGVTGIGDYAFYNCKYLEKVNIGSDVVSIGNLAFGYCDDLSEVVFQGSAPSIANNAFENVISVVYYSSDDTSWDISVILDYGGTLTWIAGDGSVLRGTCGEDVTWVLSDDWILTLSGTGDMHDYDEKTVPWYSYRDFIARVVINNGVTSIGSYSFYYCKNMTDVSIPNSVISVNNDAFFSCMGLTKLVLPDCVESIGDGAFAYCNNLMEFALPDSIKNIGNNAFAYCKSLESITIPEGIADIEYSTFKYCVGLTSITIPESVENIGARAFEYCENLSKIYFQGDAPVIEYYAFVGLNSLIYYPANNISWVDDIMQDYGGNVIWLAEGTAIDISEAVITLSKKSYDYSGSANEPAVTASLNGITLIEDEDYTVGYLDNINAGTAEVVIKGTGCYDGTAKATFTINQISQYVTASVDNSNIYIKNSTSINAASTGDGKIIYTSADTSIAAVDSNTGVVTGVAAGVVKITATAQDTINYKSASKTITITVKKLTAPVIKTVENTSTGIKLTWKAVSDAEKYYVYRKAKGESSYKKVKSTTHTYSTDTTVTSGVEYTYRIKSVKGDSKSDYSSYEKYKRLEKVAISKISNTSSGLKLFWNSVDGATKYLVYRKKAGDSTYSLVKTTSKLYYSDTDVTNGITYSYQIVAGNGNYASAMSKTQSYKRVARVTLSAPTNSGAGKMTVSWTKNAKATYYQIQYSTSSSFGSYTSVKASSSKVSKVISGLTKGKTYYVRVRPYYQSGSGTNYYAAWSAVKSVKISK